MAKKYNIKVKEVVTPSKPEKKKKKEIPEIRGVDWYPEYIVPNPETTILPVSPSVLEKNLKKKYSIPFQMDEKDLKDLLKKKVDEEDMDENHAYFLMRCRREKKAYQVYYDIVMERLV